VISAPLRARVPLAHLGALLALGVVLGAVASREPGLVLGATVSGVLALAALARPDIATVGLVFCVWCDAPAVAVDTYGAPVLVGALFPLMLAIPLVHHRMRGHGLVLTPTFALVVALGAVQVVSTLVASQQDTAVERLQVFALEGVLLYLLVINAVRTPGALRGVAWGFIAAGAFMALLALHQQVSGGFDRPYGGFAQVDHTYLRGQTDVPRLAGPLGDPNYFAQALLVVMPVCLLSVWRERAPQMQLAAAATAGLISLAIAYTYSRGAAVGFVAVLAGMAALGYVRVRHLAWIAAGVIVLLAAVPAYRDRITSITTIGGASAQVGDQTDADQSARGRSTEMRAAALAFLDHPAVGVGPGGFPFAYQDYAAQVGGEVHAASKRGPQAGEVPRREAHDLFLGVAADLGLAGLAVFLAILYMSLHGLVRARRRWHAQAQPDLANLADSFLLALVAYLVTALFLTLAFERYLWLLLAVAAACANVASRSSWRSSA
jgi:putative inorganic carbon (hco3(-)) transporter